MKQNLSKFRSRLLHGEQLRLDADHQQMAKATGTMAHEPEPISAIITTPNGFWEKLNRMLVY